MIGIWHNGIVSFNPHTHEGCDSRTAKTITLANVSIHTPTKGVTAVIASIAWIYIVSIHTPTKGVTYRLFRAG